MIRQFSAGGVVYKQDCGRILFLLRKNSPSPAYPGSGEWSLPKGWLDDAPDGVNPGPLTLGQKRASEDQVKNAALREVAEEAGVEARITARLEPVKFFFTDHNHQRVMKTVIYFLMEYQKDLPGGFGSETEETSWVDRDEAIKLLKKRKSESELISKAVKALEAGQQSLL